MSETPTLSKHKTVREALQYVADHPEIRVSAPIDMPVWEMISRILFDIANSPDPKKRGSMSRATKAQKMITDRLVGTRRPGTHPSRAKKQQVTFVDMTQGAIEG